MVWVKVRGLRLIVVVFGGESKSGFSYVGWSGFIRLDRSLGEFYLGLYRVFFIIRFWDFSKIWEGGGFFRDEYWVSFCFG